MKAHVQALHLYIHTPRGPAASAGFSGFYCAIYTAIPKVLFLVVPFLVVPYPHKE